MIYFKVVDSSGHISTGTTNDLRRFQKKHKILLLSDETQHSTFRFKTSCIETTGLLL